MSKAWNRWVAWLLLMLLMGESLATHAAHQRPYRVDDKFAVDEIVIRSLAFSPDGEALAFVRRRNALSQVTNGLIIPETRDDIWIQGAPGAIAKNLTNGAADASGWWAPQWSPDGQRLAMLSTRGGLVRIWIWDRATGQIRKLSAAVDFTRASSQVTGPNYREAFQWLDDTHLIFLAMPDGKKASPMGVEGQGGHFVGGAVERATDAWARALRGEVTASTVDSLEFKYPERKLHIVDVFTGETRNIASTQPGGMFGIQSSLWWLSPNKKIVAYVPHVPSSFQALDREAMGSPWPLELVWTDGSRLNLNQQLPKNVITETVRWAPDGRSLAFFAYGDSPINPELLYGEEGAKSVRVPKVESRRNPARLWRVDIEQRDLQRLETGDLDIGNGLKPPEFIWTATGELIFHTSRHSDGGSTPPAWLILDRSGRTQPLFRQPGAAEPDFLQAIDGGASFVGLKNGEVWSVNPNGLAECLTDSVARQVNRIQNFDDMGQGSIVASVVDLSGVRNRALLMGGHPIASVEDYVLKEKKAVKLRRPANNAAVVAFHPRSESAVYFSENRMGTYLWRVSGKGIDLLVAANKFVASIEKGERRRIEYTTLNGEKASALLVLPTNYKDGRRYPLVVDFDIGSTLETSTAFTYSDDDPPKHLADVFAAAGYAYLFASWPVTSMDNAGRTNLLLGPGGVVPGAEKVVDLGIADPDRLLIYGMSSAGYGAFGLVTQTSRFKAAVASFGYVDQTSHTLTMQPYLRYTDNPFDSAWRSPFYSNYRLPFWLNAEHMRRNSPVSYVDRVRTPLMIIHSDFDKTSITQPEMFFTALMLQRKPALFVRYWGETHGNQIPANERDMFQRIFAWFDDWADIARDEKGQMIFQGGKVKSRSGAPALRPEDFSRFGPAAPTASGP